MGKEREIHEMTGRMVYGAMVRGGPHYREFIEVQVKELGEEFLSLISPRRHRAAVRRESSG
jgi:hypothetical protein